MGDLALQGDLMDEHEISRQEVGMFVTPIAEVEKNIQEGENHLRLARTNCKP